MRGWTTKTPTQADRGSVAVERGALVGNKQRKPLVRLTEREMAAWCIVRGIDYQVEECPMAVGNKHLAYKAALNSIERQSPGSKASFYLEFVDKMSPILADRSQAASGDLQRCSSCGSPTTGEVCAFCRLQERVAGHEPVPVELVLHGKARKAYLAAQSAQEGTP